MFYYLSKIVGFVVTPLGMALVLLVGALVCGRPWVKNTLLALALVWCLVTACPWVVGQLALHLEKDYPPMQPEELPMVDVIHILGGGVGPAVPTNVVNTAIGCDFNLGPSADRDTTGVQAWRILKGEPMIVISGPCCSHSALPFLVSQNVPTNKIVVCEDPRTTEEEARWMGERYRGKKVLVVTSAIHMRRAMMLFRKYAPEVEAIPLATDYMVLPYVNEKFKWDCLLPNIDAMNQFNCVLHEYLGYWARAWR